MSQARDIAKALQLVNTETNTIVTSAIDSDSLKSSVDKGVNMPTGTIAVSVSADLPTTTTTGSQALVTSTGRLYIFNGNGWYNIATINATPYWIDEASASYTLATDGTAIHVQIAAGDSDGTTPTYTATGDSGFNAIATVTKDSDQGFTIRSIDSDGSASQTGGSGVLTFRASDGIDQASTASTFTLNFAANWSGSITQLRKDGVATNEMLGIGGIAVNANGTYAVLRRQGIGELNVYTRSGSTWSVQDTISPALGTDGVVRARNDLGSENNISITDDGTRVVVGDHNASLNSASEGNAYVYVRSGSTWSREAEFISPLGESLSNQFGWSADISGDGNYVIVADRISTGASYGGQAWIWTRSGSTWSQQAQLTQPSGASNYGMDAKINKDGTYAIVGDWTHGSDAGRVHVWKRTGTNWAIEAILTSSDLATGDRFGEFLDINDAGDYVAVAATYDDDAGTTSGSVYVFTRSGSTWSQQAKLVPTGQANPYRWGQHVSIDGSGLHVVSYIVDNGGTNKKTAIVFSRSGSSWAQTVSLATNTGTEDYANGIYRPTFSRDGFWIVAGNGAQNPSVGSNTRTGALYSYNV